MVMVSRPLSSVWRTMSFIGVSLSVFIVVA
jgi:hypothetical protein